MRRLIFVAAATLAAACSTSSSSDPATPGCDQLGSTCTSGGAMTEAVCGAQYGTWLAGGCPGGNRVGVCALATGEVVAYYPPWTDFSARYDCQGTWFAQPKPIATPGTGPTITVSCTISGVVCVDVTGPEDSSAVTSVASECSGDAYFSYAASACALADAVPGHCEAGDAAFYGAATRIFYSSLYYTVDEARASCTDPQGTQGTWVAN
jgi:hypothetical protein